MATETERPLPEAALSNPYSMLSREELDAAFHAVEIEMSALPESAKARRKQLVARRQQISEGFSWLMVRQGKAEWAGGKPKGSNPPIEVTPGPYISDYIIEDRG